MSSVEPGSWSGWKSSCVLLGWVIAILVVVPMPGWASCPTGFWRITNGGNVRSYTSESDFLANANSTLRGAFAGYGDDAGFFLDDEARVIRVTNNGSIVSYTFLADFLDNQNQFDHGSVPAYGDDAGFFRVGSEIWRVSGSGNIRSYSTFADLLANTSTLEGSQLSYADDAGFFEHEGDFWRVTDGGDVIRYPRRSGLRRGRERCPLGIPGELRQRSGLHRVSLPASIAYDATSRPTSLGCIDIGGTAYDVEVEFSGSFDDLFGTGVPRVFAPRPSWAMHPAVRMRHSRSPMR